MSLDEAASFIQSGEIIATGPMTGFPLAMVNRITAREDLHSVTFVSGLWMTLPDFLLTEKDHRFTYETVFMGPVERMFLKFGAINPASVHFHRARDYSDKCDFDSAMMDVSLPNEHGFMSIGPGSSLLGKSSFRAAKKVLAQANPHTPFLIGTDMHIHVSEVDAICEVDQPLFELPDLIPDETEIKIAQMVAERIPDGTTLQLGIGKLAYVNNPMTIAQNKNFVSINNALTVDLTGQVASESLGFAQHSATGGQLDFVRGARMSDGGMSFITLKSTANTENGTISRISAAFAPGTVITTPRSDVHLIATEYGIANQGLRCSTHD